jgi:quinol monooxygenase YgiN
MSESSWITPEENGQHNAAVRVHAAIRLLVPARKRKEARGILLSMIERIRLEEGCLSCRLYQDTMGRKALLFEQIWATEESFKKHLRSDEFRNVLLVIEMASELPEIRFDRIADSTGISTIAKVRGESYGPHNEKASLPL